MKFTLFFLLSLLLLWGCNVEPSSNATNGNNAPPTTVDQAGDEESPFIQPRSISPSIEDTEIISSKKVGQITKGATESDIIAIYGQNNVQRREIGLGEGETASGTIVFPGTKDELIIEWMPGEEYEKISRIRIYGENSEWHTEEGIHIGTTLEELIEINGRPFKFYGFEWDYAGTTNEWEGGKVDKSLTVTLTPDNPEAAFPDLLGDQLFPSDHPKAEAAGLRVSSIIINFS